MAYSTFEEIAEAVQGRSRLRSLLTGHAEDLAADDDDAHPWLDSQIALADLEIDGYLQRGGYDTPLADPVTDGLIRKASAALTVDRITETDSSRETWVDKFAASWRAWLEKVAGGDVKLSVTTNEESLALASSTFNEVPMFDTGDPYAQVHDVFPPLGYDPRFRRW